MHPPADSLLIARALAGERAAFALLWERHRTALEAVARRHARCAADADDALQETAIRALLSLRQLRDPERLRPWLCAIVRRCLPGGADEGERALDRRAVREALALLPDGQRRAAQRFYLDGWPVAQIAVEEGSTEGAVRVRLHAARVNLRDLLADVRPETPLPAPSRRNAMYLPVQPVADSFVEPLLPTDPLADDESARRYLMALMLPLRELSTILLHDRDGRRALPVFVPWNGIAVSLHHTAQHLDPEPSESLQATPLRLIEALGGRLVAARVEPLVDAARIGTLVVQQGETTRHLDASPHDALLLAARAGVPPLASTADLDAHAWPLDDARLRVQRILAGDSDEPFVARTARQLCQILSRRHTPEHPASANWWVDAGKMVWQWSTGGFTSDPYGDTILPSSALPALCAHFRRAGAPERVTVEASPDALSLRAEPGNPAEKYGV